MNDVVDAGRRALDARDTVAVFPLPGVVFFPHALLPLHIFEPRYRKMTGDALASDRLIAVASLDPDCEARGEGTGIAPVACAGVIEAAARIPDGRYLLTLRGVARIEILQIVGADPYRIARFRRLDEKNEADGPEVEADKRRLLALCAGLRHEASGGPDRATPIDGSIPFAAAVNTLCQTLNMETALKLRLLKMNDVRNRCRILSRLLARRWEEMAAARSREGREPDAGIH